MVCLLQIEKNVIANELLALWIFDPEFKAQREMKDKIARYDPFESRRILN